MAAEILLASAMAAVMAAQASKPTDVKLVDRVYGDETNIEQRSMRLIRSPEAWQRLWKEHAIPAVSVGVGAQPVMPPLPQVPFDKVMILAVFDGLTQPRRWAFVGAKVDRDATTIRVRAEPMDTGGLDVNVTPFTFLFFTRTNAKIVVEAPDRQGYVQVAEFPKIEPKPKPAAE